MKSCHFYPNHLSPSLLRFKWSEGVWGSLTSARPLRCLDLFKTSHIRANGRTTEEEQHLKPKTPDYLPVFTSFIFCHEICCASGYNPSLESTLYFLYQLLTPSPSSVSSSYCFKTRHHRQSGKNQ